MGFGEESHSSKAHFYTFLLFKKPVNSSLSPSPKQAVIILIAPFRIKEGFYSGMCYKKSFLPDWISLAGMGSSERISWK